MRYFVPIFLIVCASLVTRIPFIEEGLPYFYKEDEAHHFNRVVEMVKTGSFNPKYFHKPSLHFYLRMPVVAASYLFAAKKGHINSIQEIKTRDPYGLAGYAFTASHPGIVKWNRGFSVFLSLVLVILTYAIGFKISKSIYAASLAALLVAFSPDLLQNSAVIGVDVLMSVMCVLTVLLALVTFQGFSFARIALVGLASGLAVSSKYNALPIAALPILVVFLGKHYRSWQAISIALITPIFGFLIGSPFILFEIPLFLDQLSYEVWHYAVAGHEGHMEKPGLLQLLFYLKWLSSSAVGIPALILAACLVLFIKKDLRRFAILFAFPALYFTLMVFQKANFTRNMIVIVPFVALAASLALYEFMGRTITSRKLQPAALLIGALVMLGLPFQRGITEAIKTHLQLDSREVGDKFLETLSNEGKEVAVSGELQFPQRTYLRAGAQILDEKKIDIDKLYQDGADQIVLSEKPNEALLSLLHLEKHVEGNKGPQRVVINPEISFWSFTNNAVLKVLASSNLSSYQVSFISDPTQAEGPKQEYYRCENPDSGEEYCWIRSRVSPLRLSPPFPIVQGAGGNTITITFIVRSPWEKQLLSLRTASRLFVHEIPSGEAFQEVIFRIPVDEMISSRDSLALGASVIHSPRSLGINSDERRLGISVLGIKIEGGIG